MTIPQSGALLANQWSKSELNMLWDTRSQSTQIVTTAHKPSLECEPPIRQCGPELLPFSVAKQSLDTRSDRHEPRVGLLDGSDLFRIRKVRLNLFLDILRRSGPRRWSVFGLQRIRATQEYRHPRGDRSEHEESEHYLEVPRHLRQPSKDRNKDTGETGIEDEMNGRPAAHVPSNPTARDVEPVLHGQILSRPASGWS